MFTIAVFEVLHVALAATRYVPKWKKQVCLFILRNFQRWETPEKCHLLTTASFLFISVFDGRLVKSQLRRTSIRITFVTMMVK